MIVTKKPRRKTREAVTGTVLRRIVSGRYGAGECLPKADELAEDMQAGRVTVLRSLAKLQNDGFLTSVRGQGTFVVEHPPHLYEVALLLSGLPLDVHNTSSRFWRVLRDEASQISGRIAPMRLRTWITSEQDASNEESHASLCDDITSGSVAGLIIPFDPDVMVGTPLIDHPGIPRVTVSPTRHSHISQVVIDHDAYLDRAFEAVAADGRKRVAVILPQGWLSAGGRYAVESDIAQALGRMGLTTRPYWTIAITPWEEEAVRRLTHMMFDRPRTERPDALVLLDDHYTLPATEGVRDAGLSTPDDLTVIGYCNFPDRPEAAMPIRRLGFDIHRLFERFLDALELQRRDGTVTNALVAPVMEEELDSVTR